MVTHSASPVTRVVFEQENHPDIRTTGRFTKEKNVIVSARRKFKWFGAISTILLSTVALAQNIFGIPANLQPWVFLVAIFWALAFCSGMFDL